LVLRRNNVPIDPSSIDSVAVEIDGFFDDATHLLLCFSITCDVEESQAVFRAGDCRFANVAIWRKEKFGTVGKAKANEALLRNAEQFAEMFANDFLSANPKPK